MRQSDPRSSSQEASGSEQPAEDRRSREVVKTRNRLALSADERGIGMDSQGRPLNPGDPGYYRER